VVSLQQLNYLYFFVMNEWTVLLLVLSLVRINYVLTPPILLTDISTYKPE